MVIGRIDAGGRGYFEQRFGRADLRLRSERHRHEDVIAFVA